MTIFRTEEDKKEFVRTFRKLTASGAVNEDRAIEIIIRDNPHFFHQPTEDELKKSFHTAMNSKIRELAQPTNNLQIFSFQQKPPETGTP
jgi:plasmid replication initiation protein